jgi:mannosyltransferase
MSRMTDLLKKEKTGPLLVLAFLLLLGAGLRFHGLGRESLWNDELDSRRVSGAPTAAEVVAKTLAQDGHPPVFNLLLHSIERFWGDSERALRFPSAVAGVLAIGAIFVLGRLLYGTAEGLLGAGLLTVLWCPIYYSQEARPYSLLLAAVLVASCFWIALLRRFEERFEDEADPPFGLAAGYVLAALCCCYLHHFGAGLVVLQGLLALCMAFFTISRRRALTWALATWAAVLVGYVPGIFYLLRQRRHSGSWAWIEPPGFHSGVEYVKFLFNYSQTLAALAVAVGILGWGFGWVLSRRAGGPLERRIGPFSPSALLGLWLGLPFLGAVAVSYLSFPLLTNRNLIVGLPAAYLLLARSVTVLATAIGSPRSPRSPRRSALASLLVAALLAHLLLHMRYYEVPEKEQFREAASMVAALDPDPAGSIVLARAYHREYFDYYFARLKSPRRVDLVAGADADIEATAALLAARRPTRIWLLAGHLAVEDKFLAFLRQRYDERGHRALHGAGVWLFERRGAEGIADGGLWKSRPSEKMGAQPEPEGPPPS